MKVTYIGYFGRTANLRQPAAPVDADALARTIGALPRPRARGDERRVLSLFGKEGADRA
ncbi:hypothetical protein [uncultured Sphingomonas sp.]|uniref:hypothetical protein n=1 Tax=uncultured Sphingomonas sp. TaxID=158754 RepID=UPI00258E4482|nr:hypothetical protein [uncultured Sphingomonas sp.]